jgi:hypothetical protein
MTTKRQLIPLTGLLVTIALAGYMIAGLDGQAATTTADFRNAVSATVRDPQGQVVLRGEFQLMEEDDDDVERQATLGPTGIDADASGEAEVEFSPAAPANQEVEFSVRGLNPSASFTFAIDGVDVATATTDAAGGAEVEVDVRMPAQGAGR